jgi:hypothetical protein
MPQGKTYTIKDVINVYIQAQREDHIHPDFRDYYTRLLKALEDLFQITFTTPENAPPGKRAGYMLFTATVRSLLALRTPWSSCMEAGLIIRRLEEAGTIGQDILATSQQIDHSVQQNRLLHEKMLLQLLEYMYGERPMTFTSEDLFNKGFDDSSEPKWSDYYSDYIDNL